MGTPGPLGALAVRAPARTPRLQVIGAGLARVGFGFASAPTGGARGGARWRSRGKSGGANDADRLRPVTDPARRSARDADSTMGPQNGQHLGRLGGLRGDGGRPFAPCDDIRRNCERSRRGDDGSGVNDANRSLMQRTRHGGGAIAAGRIGPHKSLEANDDVREVRLGVEGPSPAARCEPGDVDLRDAIREFEPALRSPTGVVDDGAAKSVVVGQRRAHGLDDAVDDQIDIELLTWGEGVNVGEEKPSGPGEARTSHQGRGPAFGPRRRWESQQTSRDGARGTR